MTWRARFTVICPGCHRPFHPARRTNGLTKTCSMHCRSIEQSRRQQGHPLPEAAREGQRKKHRRRIQQLARCQFGNLSSREIDLFNFAVRVGSKLVRDRVRSRQRLRTVAA